MDFPAYIPEAVRIYVNSMIAGDDHNPHGLDTSLANIKLQLSEIRYAKELSILHGETENITILRKQEVEAINCQELLSGDMACLERLASDNRMREVFALLTREVSNDSDWRGYIHAALAARVDYNHLRDRLHRAKELNDKIAKAAEALRGLIVQFSQTGVEGPSEFYSIRELLKKTDTLEFNQYNLQIWRAMRHHVLGYDENPRRERDTDTDTDSQYELPLPLSSSDRVIKIHGKLYHLPQVHFVLPGETIEPNPLAELRYGWEKAPFMPDILRTLVEATQKFKPKESGFTGAAILSQKRNVHMEYVRAFAYLLKYEHKLEITPPVINALAITANVVINRPDIQVNSDDVRKALITLEKKRLEDFAEK